MNSGGESTGVVLTNWKAAFLRDKNTLPLMQLMLLTTAAFLIDYGCAKWRGRSRDLEDIWQLVSVMGLLLLIGPGVALLRLQRSVPAKPQFFCLPGYRESWRVLTFSAGILCGVAWSVFQEPLPGPATSAEIGLHVAGDLLAGIVLYLVCVTPRLILSRRAFAPLRLAGIPLILVGLTALSEAHDAPLVIWPILLPLLAVACVFIWIRLGDVECVRRGQRTILEDAIERGPTPGPPRTTLPGVEKWLQSQMERQGYLHAGRYVWGELYAAIGQLLHYWKWVLGVLLGGAWILGYMGPSAANVVLAASGSLACMLHSPVLSPMILPGGRNERRQAAIGTAVAASLLLMAAASAVVVFSWLLGRFLGGAPGEGQEASYVGLQVYAVFLPCPLVPWFSALGLLGLRPRSLGELALTIGMVAMIVVLIVVLAEILLTLVVPVWSIWTQPIVVAGVFVGGWLFFLLASWVVSIRCDLVGQRPTRED